jgi:NAD(P)-dependent dehydrogenase (short-subunit alcohol dehydrogenase family)
LDFLLSSIVYHPSEETDANQTKAEIEQKTGGKSKVLLIPTDLKEEKHCISSVEKTVETFGRLDVLFNNAGQQLLNNDILTLDSKQWEDTFQLNIFAYFYMAKVRLIPPLPPCCLN